MTNSHSPSSAESAVEHLQARGRHYDIIREAIAAYDEYMLDDDYDAQRTLDSIIKRMRERTALTDAPVIQSEKVTEQQIEDGAKALFGEGWDKTATPANRRYCREKAKAIFAAMAAQTTDKIQSTTLAQPAVEISQHIGWLKQYLAGMTEHNWRDMRMLAGRQLDALAAVQPPAAPVDLTDPVVVHANMLRGTIAKPTWEQIKHLYPEQFQSSADTGDAEESSYHRSKSVPIAWISFAENGNVRLWTSDEGRAKDEKAGGLDMRAFTLAELVALVSRIPVEPQPSAASVRDALEPFAKLADLFDLYEPKSKTDSVMVNIRLEDLRKARRVLANEPQGAGK